MFAFFSYTVITILLAGLFAFIPFLGAGMLLITSTIEVWQINLGWISIPSAYSLLPSFFLAVLIRFFLTEREKLNDWLYILMALGITIWASTLFSIHPILSAKEALRFSVFLGTAYFISRFLDDSVSKKSAANVLLVCIGISLLLSFGQLLGRNGVEPIHFSGGFRDWNYFTVFLAVLLPFAALKIREASFEHIKILWMAVFFITVAFAIGAGSNSGKFITLLSVCLIILFGILKKKDWPWFVPAVIALGGYLLFFALTDRIPLLLSSPPFQWRLNSNLAFLTLFTQHPFFGVGIGQFESYILWAYPEIFNFLSDKYSTLMVFFAEAGIASGLVHLKNTGSSRDANSDTFFSAAQCSVTILAAASLIHAIHPHLFTWCFIGTLHHIGNLYKENV